MTVAAGDVDGLAEALDVDGDLDEHFGHDWVDFTWHDGGAWLGIGEDEFHEA